MATRPESEPAMNPNHLPHQSQLESQGIKKAFVLELCPSAPDDVRPTEEGSHASKLASLGRTLDRLTSTGLAHETGDKDARVTPARTPGPGQPQAHRDNFSKDTDFCFLEQNPEVTTQPSEGYVPTGEAGYTSMVERQYEWLWHLRKLSSLKRLRACGLFVDTLHSETAKVKLNGHGRARWTEVCVCGLRWPCPVCAPYKAAQERRRLTVALCKAMLATEDLTFDPSDIDAPHQPKYAVIFLTATVPHKYGDDLDRTNDLVVQAWNYATSGKKKGLGGGRKAWNDAFGVEGYARALDITVGKNGWHPHIHAAVIVRADKIRELGDGPLRAGGPDVSAQERFLAWFEAWFFRRWDYRVRQLLGLKEHDMGVHAVHGVRAEWAKDPAHVARYVQKEALAAAMELTEGHRKTAKDVGGPLSSRGHRSPFQLLNNLCEAHNVMLAWEGVDWECADRREYEMDRADFESELELWHQYEAGMRGRSALRTSKGFWSHPLFGTSTMSVEEQIEFLAESVHPDERKEIEETEAVLEAVPWLYTMVVKANLDGWVLRICEEGGPPLKFLREEIDAQRWETRPPEKFSRQNSKNTLKKLVFATESRRTKATQKRQPRIHP